MTALVSLKSLRRNRSFVVRLLQGSFLALTALALALPAHAESRAIQARVAPVYPEIAKRMRITGVVKVEAVVDASGKVKDAKAVNGNHVLSTSAEDAVRRWKFAPGDGDATVEVQVNFALGE